MRSKRKKDFDKEINKIASKKHVRLINPVPVTGQYSLTSSNVEAPFTSRPLLAKAI